jgi:hypothetical protein
MAFVPPPPGSTISTSKVKLESWIRGVKEQYLDVALTKCVGLDCEYTLAKPGSYKKLPLEER